MRPRPVSYSSVAILPPGQVPAPLPAGAPSYPPAKTWQTPLPSGAENVRPGSATSTRTPSRPQSVGADPRKVGQPDPWDGRRESRPQQYQQQQTPSRPSSSYNPAPPQVQQPPAPSYLPSQSIPQSYQPQAPTAFAPSPAQLQAQQQQQQYHAQLLGYYYSYALQGLMAPATDPRQIRARDEAVARARNEGIYVVEEGAQMNGGTAGVGGQMMSHGNAAHQQQSNMGAGMSRRTSGPIISPVHRQASVNPIPTSQPFVNTYPPNHQQPVYSVPPAHSSPAIPQSYIPQHHQGHQLPQPPPTRYQSPSSASPIPYVSSPDPAMSPSLPTPHRLPQPPLTNPNYPQFATIPSSPSNSILNRASSLASSPSVYPPTHPVPIANLARATSNATPGVGPFYTLPRSSARPIDLGRSDTIAPFAGTPSAGSGATGKRPLPTPPVRAGTLPAGVVGNGARGSPIVPPIGNGFGMTSAASVVPVAATRTEETVLNSAITGLSLNGGERVSSPTSPSVSIPCFSFGDDDDPGMPSIQIEGDDSAVPSFSFSDSPTVAPLPSFQLPTQSTSPPSTTRPAHYPPLHPRQDPSHPSHYLYAPTSTPHVISPDKSVYCARCNTQMFGRALMAMGREWHPECFRCSQEGCGVKLEHVQFDGKDGEVFCMVHFEELYATPCYHCKTPIAADEFITVSDERLTPPGPRTYHALHFFCASCGDPFVDPKSLARGKEGTLAEPFMVKDGYPYCQKCDLRMFKPKCFGCKKGIVDDYAETGEGKWHLDCFTCCSCHKPLDGPYLVREDAEGGEKPYCYECYDIRARNE